MPYGVVGWGRVHPACCTGPDTDTERTCSPNRHGAMIPHSCHGSFPIVFIMYALGPPPGGTAMWMLCIVYWHESTAHRCYCTLHLHFYTSCMHDADCMQVVRMSSRRQALQPLTGVWATHGMRISAKVRSHTDVPLLFYIRYLW